MRILLIFIFCVTVAHAESLQLDGAISEAKAKSPDFLRYQAMEKEASWRPLEALSANLPKFTVTANHLFDAKFQVLDVASATGTTLFPLVSPYSLASLDVGWTVFDGLQGWSTYRAAVQNHHASELELEMADFALAERVRQKFYEALGAKILADVAQENVVTLQDHFQKTKEILDRGSATKFDLLRVQVQLEEAQSEKAGADDDVVLARKNLAVAMGMSDDSRGIEGELPVPDESKLPADLKPDFSNRADIIALQRRVDAADDLHLATVGNWIPKVTFTAEKQYYNNTDYNAWGNYRDAYALGVVLSWNVFDGGASIARHFEAAHQREQADAAVTAAQLKAPEDFETYKRRYLYNSALYRAKRRAVEMAEESVRLARLGYNAGTRTSTDVLDAELDLIRARAGVVRAQVEGADALINLELSLGKRVAL